MGQESVPHWSVGDVAIPYLVVIDIVPVIRVRWCLYVGVWRAVEAHVTIRVILELAHPLLEFRSTRVVLTVTVFCKDNEQLFACSPEYIQTFKHIKLKLFRN